MILSYYRTQSIILLSTLLLGITVFVSQGHSDQITTGHPRVIHGDTVSVDGERIRVHGIDAPEQKQFCTYNRNKWPCGRESTNALRLIISDNTIECHGKKRDRYQRLIAVCFLRHIDLNAYMVRNGWALAYRRYSKDYISEELEAKVSSSGMWRGDFIPPWDWRKR